MNECLHQQAPIVYSSSLAAQAAQPAICDRVRNHFRVDKTFILYMYKVFKHLPMQWMVLLTSQDHEDDGGGLSWLKLSNKWLQSILL